MPTIKTRTLTIQAFVGKVMSLLFNTLSRFAVAFLPRIKRLLISCLQSPSAVILEPKKIKSVFFHFSILLLFMLYHICIYYSGKDFFLETEMAAPSSISPWKSHGQRSLVGCTIHGVTKSQTQLGD